MTSGSGGQSAYEKIIGLCQRHGLITSDSMTEDELLIVLKKLLQDVGISEQEV